MIKIDSIVYYKDDASKHPYLVHEILEGGEVVLGLRDFPEVEQDFAIPQEVLGVFEGEQARLMAKEIYRLIEE